MIEKEPPARDQEAREPRDLQDLQDLEDALRARVREEETLDRRRARPSESLWDHLDRVARLAERIGLAEGVDPIACRLAGLFHDAGKFAGGRYHGDERPEEDASVETLRELGAAHGLDGDRLEAVAESILQLYRDDPDPTDLTRVLFDADNLDKLGPLGVANFFVKAGLRGGGVSERLLARLTIELTYARHASRSLLTPSGRALAARRAPQTIAFLTALIETLRDDGLFDLRVEEIDFGGLTLSLVVPAACACGGSWDRSVWEVPGLKCSEIHLAHRCRSCEETRQMRFCRPRLSDGNEGE